MSEADSSWVSLSSEHSDAPGSSLNNLNGIPVDYANPFWHFAPEAGKLRLVRHPFEANPCLSLADVTDRVSYVDVGGSNALDANSNSSKFIYLQS